MSKLDIHVGGNFADSKRRVLDAASRAEQGKIVTEDHITLQAGMRSLP
jgi:hypothetical protein